MFSDAVGSSNFTEIIPMDQLHPKSYRTGVGSDTTSIDVRFHAFCFVSITKIASNKLLDRVQLSAK
jgi:hypothetical protein